MNSPWPPFPPEVNDHPALRMVRHTMTNLVGFYDTDVSDTGRIMAQWLNSLAGLLTVCLQPLCHDSATQSWTFENVCLEGQTYFALGFPGLSFTRQYSEHPMAWSSLDSFLVFLRNGFAHGNVELVPGFWHLSTQPMPLAEGCANGSLTNILINAPAVAVRVWNTPHRKSPSTPSVVLDFPTIKALVTGLANLLQDRAHWTDSARSWKQNE